jgi:hypothetical protein
MLTARQTDQAWVEMDRERKLAAANRRTLPSFTHVREMGKPWQALGQIVPPGLNFADQLFVALRDSIVAPDGSVPPISTESNPFWRRGHD